MSVAGATKGEEPRGRLVGVVLAVAALSGCEPQPLTGSRSAGGADAGIDGAASACRRSSCPDGGCQPIVLASGLDRPHGLVIDGANAYWAIGWGGDGNQGSGAIMKVALAGGDPVVLAPGVNSPEALALDATNVYWTNYATDEILGVPKAGGPVFQVAMTPSEPWGIGIDDTNIYWTQPFADNIQSVPIGGGPVTTVATSTGDAWALAVAGSYLFYSESSAIGRAPKVGGQQWILTYDSAQGALAVDATNVYFSADHAMDPMGVGTEPGVTLEVAAIEGSTPVILASLQNEPEGLVSDGTNLYWTDPNGTIMAVPATGGDPVLIAGGQSSPADIANDCANLYWTNGGTTSDGTNGAGSVMKLAKP